MVVSAVVMAVRSVVVEDGAHNNGAKHDGHCGLCGVRGVGTGAITGAVVGISTRAEKAATGNEGSQQYPVFFHDSLCDGNAPRLFRKIS